MLKKPRPYTVIYAGEDFNNVKALNRNKKTRQSTRYAENPRDTAVFREWRPSGSLFRKNKKNGF